MTDLPRLFSELVRLETELWNAVDVRLRADHELPLTWFEPMQVMARGGSCRVNDIAAALGITIGGTSKLVDRIEASGLCRRGANPADGRSSLIELTAAGRQLLTEAAATFGDELDRRLGSALPAGDLEQFSLVLSRLRAHGAAAALPERTA